MNVSPVARRRLHVFKARQDPKDLALEIVMNGIVVAEPTVDGVRILVKLDWVVLHACG